MAGHTSRHCRKSKTGSSWSTAQLEGEVQRLWDEHYMSYDQIAIALDIPLQRIRQIGGYLFCDDPEPLREPAPARGARWSFAADNLQVRD